MPGVNFSRPLLGAGASARTDFAAAEARTGLNFTGGARFKRGFKAEIGIEAFADASAELSKFVRASIEGTAFARAQAGIQLQLPLNLFDQFGFSVRAEAIAEAAAGLVVELGLSIGDFVVLAKRDPNLVGLPLEILLLFLEEVSLGGAFEVNVSASAKAHASISIAGSVIDKPGEKAGFFYTVDAGVGLAAGVGMGLRAGAEFRDFRRFFGRAVDRLVDTTVTNIAKSIPSDLSLANGDALTPWLQIFPPVAKIAFRTAYEIGSKIVANSPGTSAADATVLCEEAVKTFLEEAQRFIITQMLEHSIEALRRFLEQRIPGLASGAWEAALPERNDLAAQLVAMPSEPFLASAENLEFWRQVVIRALALGARFANDPEFTRATAIVYASSELLMEAVRAKVNTASAYATAIGASTVTVTSQPFSGAPTHQPTGPVKTLINSTTSNTRSTVDYAHLVRFLISDIVVDPVLAGRPELERFVQVFAPGLASAENRLLKLFLQHASSFDPANAAAAAADPRALLTSLVDAIDQFITTTFEQEVLPQILGHVRDATLRLYVEEVLYPAVKYVKDVGLRTVLVWDQAPVENEDFTEALAGVLMLLLGRTVVCVGDTLLAAAEESIEQTCIDVARKMRNGDADVLRVIPQVDPELVRVVADCVEIAGVVLGPLSAATRARVRSLLYQVFEPLPPGGERDFLETLADDFFIPNGDQLQALTSELADIAKKRFADFVEKFIRRIGDYVLDSLEALIRQAIEFILNWEKNLARALQDLAAALRDLDQTIRQLNSEVIALMQACRNGFHQLFQTLGNNTLRLDVANAIKDAFVDKTLDALESNDIYKALPSEWRTQARALANGAVDGVVNSPVLTPVFAAIGELADQLDTLMPDFRELDPDDNLPEQVMMLILDRIEDNIRAAFGGDDPHISPAIDLRYRVLVYDFPFGSHWETRHVHIPLGRIEIDLDGLLGVVRDAIAALDFYHDRLNAACFRLADALAGELELAAARLTYDEKQHEHERLATLDSENTNAAKEVVILSPTALCCYTSAIDVRVHLGGVPMSYLGLKKDEAPRVLVYVNGTLIPMKSLVVESALGVRDPALHRIDLDLARLGGNVAAMSGRAPFAGNDSVIRNGKAFVVPDTARHFAGQPAARAKATAGTAVPFSTRGLKEEPVARAVYKPVDRRQTKRPVVNQTFASHNGRLVTTHGIVNTLPGRRLPPSKIGEVLDASLPGVFVGFSLELDEPFVAEGVNVITVVVIDRGGNRHQHNVSFTIARPIASAKPAPGVIHKGPRAEIVTLRGLVTQRKLVTSDDEVRRNARALIGRAVGDQAAPRKAPAVAARRIAGQGRQLATLVKHERVEIADARGNVTAETLRYRSTAERTRQLADLGLDPARLAKARRRLKTVDVAFEKADPRDTASPEIKSLVPFSEALLARRRAEAREYLEQQFALTFARTAREKGTADAL